MSCWGFFSLIIFILPPQKLYKINGLLINLCPYRSQYIWPHLLVIGWEDEEGGVGEDGDLPILLKLRCFCCRLKVRICFAHPGSEDKCKWILFLMKGKKKKRGDLMLNDYSFSSFSLFSSSILSAVPFKIASASAWKNAFFSSENLEIAMLTSLSLCFSNSCACRSLSASSAWNSAGV